MNRISLINPSLTFKLYYAAAHTVYSFAEHFAWKIAYCWYILLIKYVYKTRPPLFIGNVRF